MAENRTRRSLLRSTAGVAGAAAIGGLAGCSSVPFFGGGGSSSARDWLYDPTAFTDEPQLAVLYEAPAGIDDQRDQLHPEVREGWSTPLYSEDLDPAATDWALFVTEQLFEGPSQHVWSGSFDEAAARGAATVPFDDGTDPTETGEIDGLTHLSAGGDVHGAYGDGLAVGTKVATASEFEGLVTAADDEGDRLSAVSDGLASFLDALGFDHTVNASIGYYPRDDDWYATGTAYRIEGETTTARWVMLNEGWTEEDVERTADAIDGVDEVSVEFGDQIKWIEIVADTDRLGLNGNVFTLYGTPYE